MPHEPDRPEATCRHCGKYITLYPNGHWVDDAGFMACVKDTSPYMTTGPVLHLPMPDGLRGASC